MTAETTMQRASHTSSRSLALSALWRMILGQEEALRSVRTEMTGRSLVGFKLGNDQACKIIKVGITSKALDTAGDLLGLTKSQFAHYLDLDRGTVTRLAAKDQLLPTHAAEGVLRLLELDAMASETFETEDEATAWLTRPHTMLDEETPLSAAKTSFGAQRVKDILLAIRYGGVV
jgi:putative toxin-antitoxin system antitoxin component (TIGR02293 family)